MFAKITLATLTLLSTAALALPNGEYSGDGAWKSKSGANGVYVVTTKIQGDVITNTYAFSGGSKTFTMEAVLDPNGFFPVKVDGVIAGSGYCLTVQCHYTLDNGLEETLTFYKENLYRLGSKTENGELITWEEALNKVK